jgi:hypothetical protein
MKSDLIQSINMNVNLNLIQFKFSKKAYKSSFVNGRKILFKSDFML